MMGIVMSLPRPRPRPRPRPHQPVMVAAADATLGSGTSVHAAWRSTWATSRPDAGTPPSSPTSRSRTGRLLDDRIGHDMAEYPARTATSYLSRHVAPLVREALGDTPAVVLNGPRQAGKSTLAKEIAAEVPRARYLSFDDPEVVVAAVADPRSFVRQAPGLLVVDELQRVPELTLALKAEIDRDRRAGRYLLTGSTRYVTVPRLGDSLAGRVEIIDLMPLSQGELIGRREGFIQRLFDEVGELVTVAGPPLTKRDYLEAACRGGFPELRNRSGRRRDQWFSNYVRTVTQVDIRDLADIDRLAQLPRLLQLAAARTAGVLNKAALAGEVGLPQRTLDRYLSLLEAVFLIRLLPAWSRSLSKRVVRSPKLHLVDSGLAAHLLGTDLDGLMAPDGPSGQLLETFVIGELAKQASWSAIDVRLHHYRTYQETEVDVVLEARGGRVAGIEVKAGSTVRDRDLRGLRQLSESAGRRFAGGVVLYTGDQSVHAGERLAILPLSTLWSVEEST